MKSTFLPGMGVGSCPQIAVKSYIDLKKHFFLPEMSEVHLNREIIALVTVGCSASVLYITTILYLPNRPLNFLGSLCLICVK